MALHRATEMGSTSVSDTDEKIIVPLHTMSLAGFAAKPQVSKAQIDVQQAESAKEETC